MQEENNNKIAFSKECSCISIEEKISCGYKCLGEPPQLKKNPKTN